MGSVLFIPVSGGAGSGEVQRCKLLANALAQHSPRATPRFVLAKGTSSPGWPTTTIAASPTQAVVEVIAAIESLQPDVVVFDGNTRVAALDAARSAGARTVLISSRPSARDRGFRWRRMARLDAHWLIGIDLLVSAPGWRERLARLLFPRVAVRRHATLFANPAALASLLSRLGIKSPYVVVCPGGRGHRIAGQPAHEIFARVADIVAERSLPVVAVMAPGTGPALHLEALPNAELMALLAAADAALLGGGSLLVQALALGTPVLTVPLQREQEQRVAWLLQRGYVHTLSDGSADTIADELLALAKDANARQALHDRLLTLGLNNGLDTAVHELAQLAQLD